MENRQDELPVNVDAEKAILGGILLDNDRFFEDADELSADDFSLSSHQSIFRVINDLMFGEVTGASHADIVTISNELRKRRELENTGGVHYLASLTEGLPRRPSIREYVNIIQEKAKQRKLAVAGRSLFYNALRPEAEVSNLLEQIQKDVTEIEAEETAGSVHVGDVTASIREKLMEKRDASFDKAALHLTWGLEPLDAKTKGAFGGELTVVGGESGGGKMMDVMELIPTTHGYCLNGALFEGFRVFGEDGMPYEVIKAHPWQMEEGYKVSFDDGTSTVVHGGHLWHTFTHKDRCAIVKRSEEFRKDRREKRKKVGSGKSPWTSKKNSLAAIGYMPQPVLGSVKTTDEIRRTLRVGSRKRINHSVMLTKPVQMPEIELPIDPYVLGAWLGDGTSGDGQMTISVGDASEILTNFSEAGYEVTKQKSEMAYGIKGLKVKLRALGVLGNKHIPIDYLWASQGQREAILQGLMDTDGCCNKDGQVEFCNTKEGLSRGVYHLAASLGLKPFWSEGRAKLHGKDHGPKYIVKWTATTQVFRLRRKAVGIPKKARKTQGWRYITGVEPVGLRKMRCITTNNPSGLYLFGENFNVTHNTMLAIQMAVENALLGVPVGIFSMEMSKEQFVQRMYPLMSKIVTASLMRDPRGMTMHTHLPELDEIERKIKGLPIFIDDTSPMTFRMFIARMKKMIRENNVQLFIGDYLQLFSVPGEKDLQLIQTVMFGTRDFIKKKENGSRHIVLLSQYAKEQGLKKKRRTMGDLHGGAVIHQAAQNVLLITVESPDKKEPGSDLDAEIAVAKQREGPPGRVVCRRDSNSLRYIPAPPEPEKKPDEQRKRNTNAKQQRATGGGRQEDEG